MYTKLIKDKVCSGTVLSIFTHVFFFQFIYVDRESQIWVDLNNLPNNEQCGNSFVPTAK
jgi:hypothetical protein